MQYYISNIIFLFYSIRYLNAVKYTRRLSTEYPPELRRVPGLIESTATVYITWPYANAELHKKRKAKKAGFTSHKHQSISAGDHLVARCNLYVLFSLLKYI